MVLDAAVDAAIAACGGDARAAVRALIVANNYLEAEVKRLAEAVSSGFTRGFKAKGKAEPVFPDFKDDRTKWRQDIDSRFPHLVELVPPEGGFPNAWSSKLSNFLCRSLADANSMQMCRAMSPLSAIALPRSRTRRLSMQRSQLQP